MPQAANVNDRQNALLIQCGTEHIVAKTAVGNETVTACDQQRGQTLIDQCVAMRMLALTCRRQLEIDRQFEIQVRENMRRITKPRFLGDFFFAIGIGAVLLVTASGDVRTRAQPLVTFRIALVRQFLPGGMRFDHLAVVSDLPTVVRQAFAQLLALTQNFRFGDTGFGFQLTQLPANATESRSRWHTARIDADPHPQNSHRASDESQAPTSNADFFAVRVDTTRCCDNAECSLHRANAASLRSISAITRCRCAAV